MEPNRSHRTAVNDFGARATPPAGAAVTDGLNFGELLKIIKLRRKLVYLFTAFSILGALFRQVFYVPLYQAQAHLSIEKVENSPLQLALGGLGTSQLDTSDRLKKYIDYLQSYDFFLTVAETLKFKDGYQLLNLNNPADLTVTHKRFWKQFLNTHFGNQLSADHGVEGTPEPVLVPVEKLAGILAGMISAESSGADSIKIKTVTLDPLTSAFLANTASEVFVHKTSERDYAEVTEVKKFIEEQLGGITDRLKQSESGMIDFKKRHNLISMKGDHNPFSDKLGAIEIELEANRLRFEENRKLIEYYENALSKQETRILSQGSASITNSAGDLVGRLRQQMDTLRYKKVLMQSQGYADHSWQMVEIDHDIDRTAGQLKKELGGVDGRKIEDQEPVVDPGNARQKLVVLKEENKALELKIGAIDQSRSGMLKNLETLPKDEQLLLTITRDVDLQFELYSSLRKKLQEVEIQQVALQSHVSISERANGAGPLPRTDLIVKMLFAILIGVFLGGVSACVLEAVDPTIKHPYDMERLEMITLGSIPHVLGSPLRQSLGMHSYRPDLLICKEKPESSESMAFKHIRAQLTAQRGTDGTPTKVICVTSPERGDGKSFVASNLAVSLAQLEKKTILIDCDLRNPSIPWLFGYKSGDGLSSLLTLKASLDEILLRQRIPHLDILPAGWAPHNPTELISNEKFRVLLDHLRSTYDYIVIDSPPAVAVVDAPVIAALSDSVIMTAGFRKTKKDMMLMALRRILSVSHKNIYSVLNNVWELNTHSSYDYINNLEPTQSALEPLDSRSELEKFEKILGRKKAG